MKITPFALFFLLVFIGCSAPLPSKKNVKKEAIYRKANETTFILHPLKLSPPQTYSWEKKYLGLHPLITKQFFQCRGSSSHLSYPKGGNGEILHDCNGHHGLPLVDGKEHVYPALINVLNYLQEKTGKKVVITTGHRCPTHNRFADPSRYNWNSKHQLGAEVDFYVEGLQEEPETLIALIQQYYKTTLPYLNHPDYTTFLRYERGGLNVVTPPWFNKEIFIKLYQKDEGRDLDNSHPYPYLSIQMRYDKNKNERVLFDESQAKNYLRTL